MSNASVTLSTPSPRGLAGLANGSTAPKTVRPAFDAARCGLRILLHQSPRTFDKPIGVWMLEVAASDVGQGHSELLDICCTNTAQRQAVPLLNQFTTSSPYTD